MSPAATSSLGPEHVLLLRKRVRLSQLAFARRLHTTRRTISRWETGEATPSAVHVEQMRRIWGHAMGDLTHDDGHGGGR